MKVEFVISEVIDRKATGTVALLGSVRGGKVLAGMCAKALAFSSLYMKARIGEVGCSHDAVKLSFDMPDPDIREEWVVLCQVGNVLLIEE